MCERAINYNVCEVIESVSERRVWLQNTRKSLDLCYFFHLWRETPRVFSYSSEFELHRD